MNQRNTLIFIGEQFMISCQLDITGYYMSQTALNSCLAVSDNSYTKCSLFVVVIDLNKIISIFLRHVSVALV